MNSLPGSTAPAGRLEHDAARESPASPALRVEHLDGHAGGNFFAKAILSFEDRAVGAFLQGEAVKFAWPLSSVVKPFSAITLPSFPGIDIGGIRRGHKFRRKPATAHRHHVARD